MNISEKIAEVVFDYIKEKGEEPNTVFLNMVDFQELKAKEEVSPKQFTIYSSAMFEKGSVNLDIRPAQNNEPPRVAARFDYKRLKIARGRDFEVQEIVNGYLEKGAQLHGGLLSLGKDPEGRENFAQALLYDAIGYR